MSNVNTNLYSAAGGAFSSPGVPILLEPLTTSLPCNTDLLSGTKSAGA